VERDELQRELEKVKGVLGRVVTQRAASGVVAEWSKTPDTERAPDGMEVRVLDLGSIHVVEKVQRGDRGEDEAPLCLHMEAMGRAGDERRRGAALQLISNLNFDAN
jgi:hypothetical protein